MALRMTRRLDSGLIKIKDRKKNDKGEFEDVFHVLGAEHSPSYAMVEREKEVIDEADPEKKKKKKVKIKGDFKPAKDEKGRQIIGKHGATFEVNDEDYVLSNHGAILEKC